MTCICDIKLPSYLDGDSKEMCCVLCGGFVMDFSWITIGMLLGYDMAFKGAL